MAVRVGNLPPGLRDLVTPRYEGVDAEFVVVDRKALEASGADGSLRLAEAYGRVLGAELVTLPIEGLPSALKATATKLAGGAEQLTGQAVLHALENPSALDPKQISALPELAALLRERLGQEELAKGTLATGLPVSRASEAEINRFFAAAVAELRAGAGGEKIGDEGAERLTKLAKQVLLNYGGGLMTRAFFDGAVGDLHTSPGIDDGAMELLTKFRTAIQPGRTSHARHDDGALIKLDAARRRSAELSMLNPTQQKALEVVGEAAKEKVPAARAAVLAKIQAWGFTEADLDKVVAYVTNYARVTIQFNPDRKLTTGGAVIDAMIADPNYRNQFETKISGGSLGPKAGSSRDGWEKEIFRGVYHDHELIPEERPKYGGLSPLNHPAGNGGSWYGRCFFELRQDVKYRTTFTPRNSSGCKKDDVTTIDSIEVLLKQIVDNDPEYLKQLFAVAKGEKVSGTKNYSGNYIEAQTHGSVDLARDVEFVVVDKGLMSNAYGQKLQQLAEKIGATVKYTDQSKFFMEPT